MVAGAREPVVSLVDRTLAGAPVGNGASLIPGGERRRVADAALVNGVAAHVLDYDDVALHGHPSAVLVPAILAQAETSESSGAEMMAAYLAGVRGLGGSKTSTSARGACEGITGLVQPT